MKRLMNQTALITGGSRGIGFAIAEAYFREGAKVAVCGRDPKTLEKAGSELSTLGDLLTVPCDVSDSDQVEKMVEKIAGRFGRIDILVNNAGIGMTYGRAGEIDPKRWAYVIGVNLVGTFNCCHAVLPAMLKQCRGKIINLKGYGADLPSPRVTAYGASKAAIVAFTRSLAREYRGTGITANILSPGVVKTELLVGRDATPEGAAYLEKFDWVIDLLAGPAARPAALAVRMGSAETDGMTGREFRVMSKGALTWRLVRLGLGRFGSRRKRR